MGLRGPKPTPTAILEARGSWRAKGRSEKEVKFHAASLRCPRYMGREAKALWKRLAPVLKRAEVLSEGDLPAFEMLCETYGDYRHARDMMKREGMTATAENGYVAKSAWRQIADRSFRDFLSMAAQFGLTPSSRSGAAKVEAEEIVANLRLGGLKDGTYF